MSFVKGSESQEKIDSVLGNPLIIKKLCSFTTAADLLNFRLVNHLFHHESTRRLRVVQSEPIKLKEEIDMTKFMARMQIRIDPGNPNSFPFTAYQLNLQNSAKSLEQFVAEVGQHVRLLSVYSFPGESLNFSQPNNKLISMLSHTPNLAEIHLKTCAAVSFPSRDATALPWCFPRRSVVKMDYKDLHPKQASKPKLTDPDLLLFQFMTRERKPTKIGF